MLDNLADGFTHAESLASYPSLVEEDIRACRKDAAELASERVSGLQLVSRLLAFLKTAHGGWSLHLRALTRS